MGTFSVTLDIGNLEGGPTETLEALVDTGAFYSQAPASLLQKLGIKPYRNEVFELADGSRREYPVGTARVILDGREELTPVIFGPEVEPILGALTLELLGKVVDPVNRRLEPVLLRGRPF